MVTAMEVVTCPHNEGIVNAGPGIKQGICKNCGQVRTYNTIDKRERPKVLKLGRINGAIVLPGSGYILELSLQEKLELRAVEKALAENPSVTEEEKTTDIPTGQPSSRGKPWYREHKKEMIEDLLTMGNPAFLKKWQVKRQVISHLKSDKLYKNRVALAKRAEAKQAKSPETPPKRHKRVDRSPQLPGVAPEKSEALKARMDQLPRFPDWDPEGWSSGDIAVQWLKTYEALARLQLINEEAQRVKHKRNWLARIFRK